MHEKLLHIVRKLNTDFEPFGEISRDDQPDCSYGCRHFINLAREVGDDWGICSNQESPRVGLLTFEHQGCFAFAPITLDRSLADSQLRQIIADASEMLKARRRERDVEVTVPQTSPVTGPGQFIYDIKTSYFPHIKGHCPAIFRLEKHEAGFVAIPLEIRISGNERPVVTARDVAKNGEVFKIVRENGEFSYQVPFNGRIFNLKQHSDLCKIGLSALEGLRHFLECVETEVFEKLIAYAPSRLKHARRDLEDSRDRVRRWRQKQFWATEVAANARERREMLQEEEANVKSGPNQIAELEAFIEWLNTIDRSNPTLASIPVPLRSNQTSRRGEANSTK
jgi:hypothetical protein